MAGSVAYELSTRAIAPITMWGEFSSRAWCCAITKIAGSSSSVATLSLTLSA